MRKIIYHPSGRAGEYADHGYAVNLFKGCTHGCKYCYVPMFTHQDRATFHASVTPAPDVLERLKADMKRVGVLDEPIFMCFTCDPYCIDAPEGITRAAIKIIIESGNRVNILTKAGVKAKKDFDLLCSVHGNKIGATLTFYDLSKSVKWEPRASWPSSRIIMLEDAKFIGIQTWASIEPVIIPGESLAIMEEAIPYVDEFKIGKLNHHPLAQEINWKDFALKAVDLMEKHNKKYLLKQDLIKAARI